MNDHTNFFEFPRDESVTLAWPTLNQLLFEQPGRFIASTRANPAYGRPGWTRDCGRRFHRGIDIAPLHPRPTSKTTRVLFSDCIRGCEYPSDEPTFEVDEPVFAMLDGEVVDTGLDPQASTWGCFVKIRHRWPISGADFFSIYAHLQQVDVTAGMTVPAGHPLGRMGQTSSSADARNWMAIAPHLHLEFRDAQDRNYDPEALLRRYLPARSGGA